MDIIVIKQKDGTLMSTPFHLRFGAFKIMKVKDILIKIEINNEIIPFTMNLAEDGHGYFLKELIDPLTKNITYKYSKIPKNPKISSFLGLPCE